MTPCPRHSEHDQALRQTKPFTKKLDSEMSAPEIEPWRPKEALAPGHTTAL
jgi:hypothetical protein